MGNDVKEIGNLPVIHTNTLPPHFPLLRNPHIPPNIRIRIRIPRGMQTATHALEIHDGMRLSIVWAWRLGVCYAEFHCDEPDGFGGLEGWTGCAWWHGGGCEIIGEEVVEIWSLEGLINLLI